MTLEDRYNNLKIQAIGIKSRKDLLEERIAQQSTQLKEKELEVNNLIQESETTDKAIQSLKLLIELLSNEHINKVTKFINEGLEQIFYDKTYELEIVIEDKRNQKQANLFLLESTSHGKIKSSLRDGVGGGILTIIGFLLQIYYIKYYDLVPIIFLDETFTQLSSRYVPNLKQFMAILSKDLNFIFIFITHDERFISDEYSVYEVENGEYANSR